MGPALTRKVQSLLLEYYDDYEMPARLYTLLALISLALDIISFIAVLALLGGFIGMADDTEAVIDLALAGDIVVVDYLTAANPYLGRIIVIMLYTTCDVLFILWIIHFRARMGQLEKGYVHKALLGFGNEMRIAFGVMPKGNDRTVPPKAPGRNNRT